MSLALADHLKGVGLAFHPVIQASMAASSSATLLKTPRRICWRVISANSRSTRLIQDDDVGVKCSLKRGCLASQACTSLVLWVLYTPTPRESEDPPCQTARSGFY